MIHLVIGKVFLGDLIFLGEVDFKGRVEANLGDLLPLFLSNNE